MAAARGAVEPETQLLFTGDILLSRQARREIERTGRTPWAAFARLFSSASWVVGNLEGAVGPESDCTPAPPERPESPCFDVPATLIPLLAKANFRAIGTANNHSSDLGPRGEAATREALQEAGIANLSFESSPVFHTFGSHTVAFIALSAVPGRDGRRRTEIPSTALSQKLRLARTFSQLVVVYVHWGSELLDWPNSSQRENAKWLIENGVDLIVGHHPHVIQAPECILGKPVFFSLGNHVFDQKYPETKKGLIADCRIRAGVLSCGGILTRTPPASSLPLISTETAPALPACTVALRPPLAVAGFALAARSRDSGYLIEGTRAKAHPWLSQMLPLISAEIGKLAGPEGPDYLFTLERHSSPLDKEEGVRPYVYEVKASGLVARWRGSALAWPLADARILPGNSAVLCALHRTDSFLVLRPDAGATRVAAYRWNGFGFSGIDDPEVQNRCGALFPR
jgi:poly-gamma-glutamate synthesis protein (capsule biosynthesis protein)